MSLVAVRDGEARLPDLPVGVPFPAAPARPGWYVPAKRALDIAL